MAKSLINGAPEEIRTPDPQIRSLVLYPAELRARFSLRLGLNSPSASENVFGRSRKSALATGSGLIWQGPERRHLSGSSFRGAQWREPGILCDFIEIPGSSRNLSSGGAGRRPVRDARE